MDMPTPCNQCDELADFNDFRKCDHCKELVCPDCYVRSYRMCNRCIEEAKELGLSEDEL
jgi:hypothetical protein